MAIAVVARENKVVSIVRLVVVGVLGPGRATESSGSCLISEAEGGL